MIRCRRLAASPLTTRYAIDRARLGQGQREPSRGRSRWIRRIEARTRVAWRRVAGRHPHPPSIRARPRRASGRCRTAGGRSPMTVRSEPTATTLSPGATVTTRPATRSMSAQGMRNRRARMPYGSGQTNAGAASSPTASSPPASRRAARDQETARAGFTVRDPATASGQGRDQGRRAVRNDRSEQRDGSGQPLAQLGMSRARPPRPGRRRRIDGPAAGGSSR